MKIQYLCGSWQGLIQQVVYLVSRGYYYHHIEYLPQKKSARFPKIDQKLIEKYKADKSKYQRARQKNKKIANFYYLRWDNIAIIMHTLGAVEPDIFYDDKFIDIRHNKGKINLKISDYISLDILLGELKQGGIRHTTVKLDKQTYAGFKNVLRDISKTHNKAIIKREFNKLNGLPAWSGIIEQKRKLAKFLIKEARHNQVDLAEKELRINTFRQPVKVFI